MKLKLTSTGLKWIAIIAMIIDHVGATIFPYSVYPNMIILRVIGRIAFPIFAFLIVEGYMHTKDVKKYGIRLLAFAVISEIPFDLAFFGKIFMMEYQNVFFTLVLGLLGLYAYDKLKDKNKVLGSLAVFAVGLLALLLKTDYNIFGVLIIFGIYTAVNKPKQCLWIAIVNIIMAIYYTMLGGSYLQIFALLSIPFIIIYNGEPGKRMKYLFYIIYPGHIFILFLIQRFIL